MTEPAVVILVIILALQTLVFIALALFMVQGLRRMQRTNDRVQQILDSAQPSIQEILDHASDFVQESRPVSAQLVEISINLKEISRMLRETSQDVKNTMEEAAAAGRRQIRRADSAVTNVMDQTERVSEMVRRNILDPVVEISALLKGIRVGVEQFRNLRRH